MLGLYSSSAQDVRLASVSRVAVDACLWADVSSGESVMCRAFSTANDGPLVMSLERGNDALWKWGAFEALHHEGCSSVGCTVEAAPISSCTVEPVCGSSAV